MDQHVIIIITIIIMIDRVRDDASSLLTGNVHDSLSSAQFLLKLLRHTLATRARVRSIYLSVFSATLCRYDKSALVFCLGIVRVRCQCLVLTNE